MQPKDSPQQPMVDDRDSRLDELIDEAVSAERSQERPAGDLFLDGLEPRLAGQRVRPSRQLPPVAIWGPVAALIPLVLALLFTLWPGSGKEGTVDVVPVDELIALLEEIQDCEPDDVAEIVDTLELIEDWAIIGDSPLLVDLVAPDA